MSSRIMSRSVWFTIAAIVLVLLLIARGMFHRRTGQSSGRRIVDRSVTEPLNQPGGAGAPAEAYEIYSALYQPPMDEPLAFAQESSTDIPQLNGNCLKPRTAEEREMAAAFETANRQSHPWSREFAIPQPYRLLTPGQTRAAQNCLEAHGQGGPSCAPYNQLRHVRFLGIPGLNSAHTRALVSVVKKCGRYCGSGGIFEVRKTGSAWQRAAPADFTSDCSWMY